MPFGGESLRAPLLISVNGVLTDPVPFTSFKLTAPLKTPRLVVPPAEVLGNVKTAVFGKPPGATVPVKGAPLGVS